MAAQQRKRLEHKHRLARMALPKRNQGVDSTRAAFIKATAYVPDYRYVQDDTPEILNRLAHGNTIEARSVTDLHRYQKPAPELLLEARLEKVTPKQADYLWAFRHTRTVRTLSDRMSL